MDNSRDVIPANAGIQEASLQATAKFPWMPACAGMTKPHPSKLNGLTTSPVSRKFMSGEIVGRVPRASQLARFARPTTAHEVMRHGTREGMTDGCSLILSF